MIDSVILSSKDYRDKEMDVSIIIVSWNVKKILFLCLESILNFTHNINYEIIIVDNNSSDGTQEGLESFAKNHLEAQIKLIHNQDNVGFSRANNLGLAKAQGEFILFLNPDTEIKDNCIEMTYDFLKRNLAYGAVGCKILYPDGSIYHPCARGFPRPLNVLYEMVLLTKLFPRSPIFGELGMRYWDKNESRDVKCLVGAFIMVRHGILNQIGSFRNEFFMYGEDIDLCYRIIQAGWNIRYFAECCIIHHTEKSSEQVTINHFKTVMRAESNWLFHKLNYGGLSSLCYRTVIIIGALFRIAVLIAMVSSYFILGLKDKIIRIKKLFKTNGKLLSWALGMERWVKEIGSTAGK